MLSKSRSTVHAMDTTDRPSTGITRLPLIPVDGDTSANTVADTPSAMHRGRNTRHVPEPPLTSLELFRQLEAFVRELFEITTAE